MQDEQFERLLREAVADYRQPTATPRHEMWQRLQMARAARLAPRRQRRHFPFVWAAGIAAGVTLGVGVGRMVRQTRVVVPAVAPAVPSVADAAGLHAPDTNLALAPKDKGTTADPLPRARVSGRSRRSVAPSDAATPALAAVMPDQGRAIPVIYRATLADYLSQTEVLLTLFRVSLAHGSASPIASSKARQLLGTNRLLLDSPVSADQRTRALLEDLELTLVRIAQVSPRARADQLQSITAGIDRGRVLDRVRNHVPAGSRFSTTGGML